MDFETYIELQKSGVSPILFKLIPSRTLWFYICRFTDEGQDIIEDTFQLYLDALLREEP